eukprot:EG_transcript_10217
MGPRRLPLLLLWGLLPALVWGDSLLLAAVDALLQPNVSALAIDPLLTVKAAACDVGRQQPFFWESAEEDVAHAFIARHQHPEDCDAQRFVTFPVIPNLRGLAQSLSEFRHGLLCAIAAGRLFVAGRHSFWLYAHPRFCPDQSLQCYVRPLAGCADRFAAQLPAAEELNSTYAELLASNATVVRQQISLCPDAALQPLAMRLNCTLAGLHQVAQQYLTRPSRRVLDAIRQFGRPLSAPYMSVHIRTGKLFAGHNERVELHDFAVGYPLHRYAKLVHHIALALQLTQFFVSIDDWKATEGFASLLAQYFRGTPPPAGKRHPNPALTPPHAPLNISVHYLPYEAFPLQTIVSRHSRVEDNITEYYCGDVDEAVTMLANIHLLSHGRFFLSTGVSQVDVAVKQLMRAGPRVSPCAWEIVDRKACHKIGLCHSNWNFARMWPRD